MDDLDSRILHAMRLATVEGFPTDGTPPRRLTLSVGVPHWLIYTWVRRRDDAPGFDDRFSMALKAIEADGYVTTSRAGAAMPSGDLWLKRPDGLHVFVSVNNEARLARAFVGDREGTGLRNATEAGERWTDHGLKLWRLTPDGSRLAARNGASTPEAPFVMPDIDNKDVKILEILRAEIVGVTISKIARDMRLTDKAVSTRMKKLRELGLAARDSDKGPHRLGAYGHQVLSHIES